MKKTLKVFLLISLVIAMVIPITACKKNEPALVDVEVPNKKPKDILKLEDIVGFYEWEWEMSPNIKPLVSLVLLEDSKYELYISIMGLLEEGTFDITDENTITFTPNESGISAIEGKYEAGTITAAFLFDHNPTSITYIQVGSPDDVYKEFLGDYVTGVMGTTDVTISLLPNRKYVNSLSKETGTFRIYNGEITLTPDADPSAAITGEFNLANHQMVITMSVMPGTPKAEMTFKKLSADQLLVYEGSSSIGMTGSTPVKLTLKPGNVLKSKQLSLEVVEFMK